MDDAEYQIELDMQEARKGGKSTDSSGSGENL